MSKQDKFFMSLKILSRDETPGELSVNVNNINERASGCGILLFNENLLSLGGSSFRSPVIP